MWLVPGTMSLYSDRFQLKNAALLEGPCYVTESVCNAANGEHPGVAGERKNSWNLADTRLIFIELLHTEFVT